MKLFLTVSLIETHKTIWDWKTVLNVPLNETHKTTWRGLIYQQHWRRILKVTQGKLEIIKMVIMWDFQKKLDNFENCYYHFYFTNLITQYCLTSVGHCHAPFLWFFQVFPSFSNVFSFFVGKSLEKLQKWNKTMTNTDQTVLSYQISDQK